MTKTLLQLSVIVFTAALTGMLACSSDPNGGGMMGCGGGAPAAAVDCSKGYHQEGRNCVKNKAKPAAATPASSAPTTL